MTFALPCLVALTLLVCGATAVVPTAIRERLPRPQPLRPGDGGSSLWLVQAPPQRWFLAGRAIDRSDLESLLRRDRPGGTLHYLPSSRLDMAEVAGSLRWLRSLSRDRVVLELPAEPR